jgi:hypothetical protein
MEVRVTIPVEQSMMFNLNVTGAATGAHLPLHEGHAKYPFHDHPRQMRGGTSETGLFLEGQGPSRGMHGRLSTGQRPGRLPLGGLVSEFPIHTPQRTSGSQRLSIRTFNLTIDFSPALTRLATSSSVRCKHSRSYVAFDPVRASFSRTSCSLSMEQKHRYAWPDWAEM